MSVRSASSFLSYICPSVSDYDTLTVDAVFHPATLSSSRRRILGRMDVRFAHIPLHRQQQLKRIVAHAMTHSRGRKAWAILLEVCGDPLFLLRNTACTRQPPHNRSVYRISVDQYIEEAADGTASLLDSPSMMWEVATLTGVAILLGSVAAFFLYTSLTRQAPPTPSLPLFHMPPMYS